MAVLTIERKILQKNDQVAAENRSYFKDAGLLVVNLLSSPGSGKTTLLEKTLALFREQLKMAVVEGDVQTDLDAQRIARCGVPVVQIVTNGGCHLEAKLIQEAVGNLNLENVNLLFIENVGNLVCPASYDLGENYKVVLVSTTEGDDKPLKYPKMFRVADICVLNKIDLLPFVEFDVQKFKENALNINPDLQFFEVSAKDETGIAPWGNWLIRSVRGQDE